MGLWECGWRVVVSGRDVEGMVLVGQFVNGRGLVKEF